MALPTLDARAKAALSEALEKIRGLKGDISQLEKQLEDVEAERVRDVQRLREEHASEVRALKARIDALQTATDTSQDRFPALGSSAESPARAPPCRTTTLQLAVGVDIGGTNVRVGLAVVNAATGEVERCGEIVGWPLGAKTNRSGGAENRRSYSAEAVADRAVELIAHVMDTTAQRICDGGCGGDAQKSPPEGGGGKGGKGGKRTPTSMRPAAEGIPAEAVDFVTSACGGSVALLSSDGRSRARRALAGAVRCIAVSQPGQVPVRRRPTAATSDPFNGVVVEACAFPDWPRNVPFGKLLRAALRARSSELPMPSLVGVSVVEDAKAHLMGEVHFGDHFRSTAESPPPPPPSESESESTSKSQSEPRLRSVCGRDAVIVCVGTGVGTAAMVGGRLVLGAQGLIEGGHITTATTVSAPDSLSSSSTLTRLCGCGQRGCLEAYASGGAIAAIAAESSGLCKLCRTPPSAADVFGLADTAPEAMEIVDAAAAHLSRGCLAMARCYDPELFIFAGGVVMGAGTSFLSRIEAHFRAQNWRLGSSNTPDAALDVATDAAAADSSSPLPKFRLSSLGEAAPVLGAIAMALRELDLCIN